MFQINKNCIFLYPCIATITVAMFFLSSCEIEEENNFDEEYLLQLPVGFPAPEIPADNPLTEMKIQLGKELFFDPILSADSSISCSSCHLPEFAFSDTVALSIGINNGIGFRNAPSLANVAYSLSFLRDGGFPTLETQMAIPVQDAQEMGFTMYDLAERLKANVYYNHFFYEVFQEEPSAFGITRAVAAFERTLISGESKYDQSLRFSTGVFLTESEQEGEELFFSDALHCSSCHSGFNFTNNGFENNGLYSDYSSDEGRERITNNPGDEGKFKVPTLRNIALTAPYMHDGSLNTLEEVIEHYMSGGSDHINKSELIQPFVLSESEKVALIDFLNTLTDNDFISNQNFLIH